MRAVVRGVVRATALSAFGCPALRLSGFSGRACISRQQSAAPQGGFAMLDLAALLLSGVAVFLGAALQGGTGTGLALVATPIVQLLRPGLMPGAMLVVAFGMALLAVADEAGHADWSGLRWALGGRLLGTACSAWAVAITTARGLSVLSGAVILVVAAVAALAPAWLPRN